MRAGTSGGSSVCAPKNISQKTGAPITVTYLTQPGSCMDIPLDAIEHGTVVLQQDTIGVSTAALQRFRVADGGG